MNSQGTLEQAHLAETQPLRRISRPTLWRLLIGSIVWSAVTFGCVTVNYVTDVTYNEKGNGALVSLGIEYDAGVYDEIQNVDSTMTSGLTARQVASGWTPSRTQADGRNTILQHRYDTLEELSGVPQLIAGEGADASDSFIQNVSVITREVGSTQIEYAFEATVVINARKESDMASLDDYPELLAAIDKAGTAKITVQTYLPGEIDPNSVNATAGEVEGGRVRWQFSEDQPGTYQLRASSLGITPAEANAAFADMFGSRERIQDFEDMASISDPQRQIGKIEAAEFLADFRRDLGVDPASRTFTPKDALLVEVAYMANFCTQVEAKKSCLMPNLHRALPLIRKIALRIGDDLESIATLSELVNQLYEEDAAKMAHALLS